MTFSPIIDNTGASREKHALTHALPKTNLILGLRLARVESHQRVALEAREHESTLGVHRQSERIARFMIDDRAPMIVGEDLTHLIRFRIESAHAQVVEACDENLGDRRVCQLTSGHGDNVGEHCIAPSRCTAHQTSRGKAKKKQYDDAGT